MAKNRCNYCYGHGLSKFWWDKGSTGSVKGVAFWHPIRWSLQKQNDKAYACDRCGLPKDLPSPPIHKS